MTWQTREPADDFFRRMQGVASHRADNHPDPAERQASAEEVERLNALIGQFGKVMPK